MVFADHFFETSKTVRTAWRRYRWYGITGLAIATCLFVYGSIMLDEPFESSLFALGCGCTFGGLFMIFSQPLYKRRNRKLIHKMYHETDKNDFFNEVRAELLEDGISLASISTQSTTKWIGIERIDLLKDHTLVYLGPASAYVIPRSSVVEGDFEAFSTTLKSRFTQFKSQQTAESR